MSKIVRVNIHLLSGPIKRPFSASAGRGRLTRRETVLIQLTTEDGLVGWGETSQNANGSAVPMTELLRGVLAPIVLEQSPIENYALWTELSACATTYGTVGLRAMSALDAAIWDLRAQVQDQSLAS